MKKHIPNMITCSNLICGCIATGAAFHANYVTAFLFIVLGAVFDFFDGLAARSLGVSGKMGVELDSLADCVTFGVAPSAMIFTLFTKVCYPEVMYDKFFFTYMPFTAFLMSAFSALRLAKFNIDERQHLGFIGMPTPANAIFWAALISSSRDFLCSPHFNAPFLLAFVVLSCWLLVCEVPMFALKFKNLSWADNKIKFIFLAACVVILGSCAVMGGLEGTMWQTISKGLAACIGLYVITNLLALYLPSEG